MATTYIKLSGYIRDYLITKYRSNPIEIPSSHHLSYFLENYILPNPDVRKIAVRSLSEYAMKSKLANDGGGDYRFIPSDEEKDEFLGFKLPEFINVGREQYKTNDTWQFSGAGVQLFRKQLKKDFWSDLEMYLVDYSHSCTISNTVYMKETGIERFMLTYNIRTEAKETILRYERRHRTRFYK